MKRTADRIPASNRRPALRNERGASILLALFYFLVCAVVGAVVLTAATVTTGQLVALERSQQAYYSVTSAAELLRDSIVGGTCAPEGTCALPDQSKNGAGQEALQVWVKKMVEKVSAKDVAKSAFDVSFASSSQPVSESVLDVRVTAEMSSDYSLHFTLRPKNYTEPVGDYRITLDIPAALLYGVDGATVERIIWERALIGKPLQASGGGGA